MAPGSYFVYVCRATQQNKNDKQSNSEAKINSTHLTIITFWRLNKKIVRPKLNTLDTFQSIHVLCVDSRCLLNWLFKFNNQ